MDEDEAEDVIFEGSPLFEYLKETCPSEEFESSLPRSREVQRISSVCPSKSKHEYLKMILSGLGILHISHTFKKLISWPIAPHQSDLNQKVSCQLRTLSRITKSRLLNEVDKSFLKSLERYMEDEKQMYQTVPVLYIFISGVLFLGASICFLLPHITRISPIEQPLITTVAWPEIFLGVILLLVSLSICLRGFHQQRISRIYEHLNSETDRCIHQEETFLKCFRRSLQYIQEVEVLSRGYTMVNVPSGSKETSQFLQLLPLRKVCLLVITRHLAMMRKVTKSLINGFPVPPEYKLSADCISNQVIPEWITDMATNSQTLNSHNDEELYSLSTLKILFGIYKEQCSDLYRQLVISFVYSDKLSCTDRTDLQELQTWLGIMINSCTECEESTNRLAQTYKIHRWSPTPEVNDRPKEVSRREVWRPEVQCITAIHSLRLHLETMLSRISSVDDELTDCEVINITEDRVTELQSLLADFGDHMEASQICCQEASASLEKMACREEPQKMIGDDIKGEKVAVRSHDPIERIPITAEYSEDTDGDMDEQIFEAFIDAKKKLQDKEDDSGEWLQERNQRRREAEDAKRMLQELNSVLTKRSKEKERNKQEKLMKQQSRQADLSPADAQELGGCDNTMPPAGHEYSLTSLTDEDKPPPIQRTPQTDRVENESLPEKQTECDELSVNIAGVGDDLCNRTLPPLHASYEYSLGTHEVTDRHLSRDLTRSPDVDIGAYGGSSSCPVELAENKQRNQGKSATSASIDKQKDISNPCEVHSAHHPNLYERKSLGSESTHLGKIDSAGGVRAEGTECNIRPIKSIQDSESIGIFTNEDSLRTEQEEISDVTSVPPCSYECISSSGRVNGLVASSDLSQERSFLAVNPWMASGLAAQVAKISQERLNLSEETFGEDDSDDD